MRYWFEKDSRLDPDVFGIARELRERGRAQIFVATGQEHYRAAYLWDELGFSSHFDRLFYSAEIGVPKKDLRFFGATENTMKIAALASAGILMAAASDAEASNGIDIER
ncbi:hypothetical protein [Sinorhizobium sp. 22678]|uniref:hypothetical protein n=1 Tax=Sinorhizobium sp. 22678 TaxID=3453955 RepID=UPI003F86EB80